jgi:L-seryl-tRNA(Ser) seleniumtransferase
MMRTEVAELERAARELVGSRRWSRLSLQIVPSEALLGGGSDPRASLPSVALSLRAEGHRPDDLKRRLLRGLPPIVARANEDQCLLDLRTILPHERPLLLRRLAEMDVDAEESPWTS